MAKKITFKGEGYLKHSYLGKDGDKNVTFQFSASEAIQIATLELMSRDFKNHLPVLLTITATMSAKKGRHNLVKKPAKKRKKVVSKKVYR